MLVKKAYFKSSKRCPAKQCLHLVEFVYQVTLNRPRKVNALNKTMWLEIKKSFDELARAKDCRVIVLSGAGEIIYSRRHATGSCSRCPRRRGSQSKDNVQPYCDVSEQHVATLEESRKTVLAAVHSACIGAGVAMITAADMRYCTKDAWFQVKETLEWRQTLVLYKRLPKVIGSDSLARELCYTARRMQAEEALSSGLVSSFREQRKDVGRSFKIAEEIAQKSPVAVQGTKRSLVYSRDHSLKEGLHQITLWNQLMLQSEEFVQATMGQLTKDNVKFSKL
ncbi:hypothetical protein NQ317_010626 [Molorchus minor]|uniref:Uncharacterized protein n=1 Tax=Molorchus minor TaxID=1323400 RepID=A0ABQ9JBH1_9CUCU|nr:hypothetical protein NQ317_010626 [Molorchus minor]